MTTREQRANFGRAARVRREERGLTQRELAQRIGVTESAVANWEQGTTGARERNVVALEDALDMERGELGWHIGQATPPGLHSPEIAIGADDKIPADHKRTLLAHLAEVRRIAAEEAAGTEPGH